MHPILCKILGGHRFNNLYLNCWEETGLYHYKNKCIRCGKVKEWTIPTSCIFGPTYEERLKAEIDRLAKQSEEERNKTNGQTTKNS